MSDRDNITLPREVVEKALEALEYMTMTAEHRVDNRIPDSAITALRTALAAAEKEQQMLRDGWRQCAKGQRTTQHCGLLDAAVKAEREACAKVCETEAKDHWDEMAYRALQETAELIRKRGEVKP